MRNEEPFRRPVEARYLKMTTVSIVFSNDNDDGQPIHIQVDPWAGLYLLKKGERIEIIAESETSSPSFSVQEFGLTTILCIYSSNNYDVVLNGKRVHWTDYYSNIEESPSN